MTDTSTLHLATSHLTTLHLSTLHLPPRHVLERVVELALEEDLGRGDLTTEATVPDSVPGAAL